MTAFRTDYARCADGLCAQADCPRCHPDRALPIFLDEVRAGRCSRSRTLINSPVLIYHVPRTGGSYLANVFEQLGLLLVRPDHPAEAEVVDELLRHGERRGIVILAHTAAALKARHPHVEFLEFAACWRDPYEICASEYHGIRNARPGQHLFHHHLRQQCLAAASVGDWVELYNRANPVSTVLAANRPTLLHSSNYAADVGSMLHQILGYPVDLVADFGFQPDALRPGRWVAGADRDDILRMRQLNAKDYGLWKAWIREMAPAGSP